MTATTSETVTLPLRRPIKVHGKAGPEEISTLALNMPTGRTVLRLGEPFTTKIEQEAGAGSPTKLEFKIIPSLAAEYLVDMTGYNADLLGQMHPLDVLAAFDALTRMLRPIVG